MVESRIVWMAQFLWQSSLDIDSPFLSLEKHKEHQGFPTCPLLYLTRSCVRQPVLIQSQAKFTTQKQRSAHQVVTITMAAWAPVKASKINSSAWILPATCRPSLPPIWVMESIHHCRQPRSVTASWRRKVSGRSRTSSVISRRLPDCLVSVSPCPDA